MADVKVLKDMEVGEKYTGRDIDIFIVANDDVLVISESCTACADLQTDTMFEVKAKFNGYNHSGPAEKYHKPLKPSRIFIIS